MIFQEVIFDLFKLKFNLLNSKMKTANNFLANEAPDFNYKVILVGNKRVGKTSLTNRVVFEEFNENEALTRVV